MQRMSPEATYALQEAQAACAPGGNKKQCAMTANALPIDHGADLCMRPNGNQACAQVQVECREGGDPEACQKALSKLTE